MFMGFVLWVCFIEAQPPISLQAQPPQAFTMGIVGKQVQAPSGSLTFRLTKPGRYPMTITFAQPQAKPIQLVYEYAGKGESLVLRRQANGTWKLGKTAVATSPRPSAAPVSEPGAGANAGGGFAEMLTQASGTPLPVPQTETVVPVGNAKPDTSAVAAYDPQLNINDTLPQASAEIDVQPDSADGAGPSGVIKYSSSESDSGTAAVFLDFKGERTDTVKVYLSNSVTATINMAQALTDSARAVTTPIATGTAGNPYYTPAAVVATDSVSVTPTDQAELPKSETVVPSTSAPVQPVATTVTNEKCAQLATDQDVQKLRKRMVNDGTDAGMLQLAGKALRQKCYSTDQIRVLGLMFLNDEARYNFFSASYASVYDPQNWAALSNQLIGSDWRNRFLSIPGGR